MTPLEAAERVVPQWYPWIRLLAVTGMRFSEETAFAVVGRRFGRWSVDHQSRARARQGRSAESTSVARRTQYHRSAQGPPCTTQAPGFAQGWCFPSDVGGLLFNAALTAAGPKCTPTPHWFRRTLNRLLTQSLNSNAFRSAMLGHVTDWMRLHYDHVFLDEKRNAVVGALSQ